MPASFCYWYMQLLGRLYYLVRRRERRQIETNIREMLKNNKIWWVIIGYMFKYITTRGIIKGIDKDVININLYLSILINIYEY